MTGRAEWGQPDSSGRYAVQGLPYNVHTDRSIPRPYPAEGKECDGWDGEELCDNPDPLHTH